MLPGQIGALLEGGVDLIVLENFQDIDELLIALHVKQSLHHCPAICSFAAEEDGLLAGGIPLEFAFKKLIGQDADSRHQLYRGLKGRVAAC